MAKVNTTAEQKDLAAKKLRQSPGYLAAEPKERLLMLLDVMTFDELLAAGFVLGVNGMAQRTGFSPQHVRRLAHEGLVPCLRRASHEASGNAWIYFLREQVSDFWRGAR